MRILHVRGVPDSTMVRLEETARRNGLTLSEYIRRSVETLAVIGELRELDDKYTRLVATVSDAVDRFSEELADLKTEVAALRRRED